MNRRWFPRRPDSVTPKRKSLRTASDVRVCCRWRLIAGGYFYVTGGAVYVHG